MPIVLVSQLHYFSLLGPKYMSTPQTQLVVTSDDRLTVETTVLDGEERTAGDPNAERRRSSAALTNASSERSLCRETMAIIH